MPELPLHDLREVQDQLLLLNGIDKPWCELDCSSSETVLATSQNRCKAIHRGDMWDAPTQRSAARKPEQLRKFLYWKDVEQQSLVLLQLQVEETTDFEPADLFQLLSAQLLISGHHNVDVIGLELSQLYNLSE